LTELLIDKFFLPKTPIFSIARAVRQKQSYWARKLIAEFPNKTWTLSGIENRVHRLTEDTDVLLGRWARENIESVRRRPPASAICRYWSSTGSTRSDSHWAAEFRRQQTYRLEQSAISSTFARSVAERLQAGTEDSSLLIRPATLSRFRDFAAAYKSADLLTYLHC